MNLIENVKKVEAKYQQGNNIFRRVSVGFLLERISQLEQAAQQNAQRMGYQTAIIPCPHCGVNVTIDSDSFIAHR